MRAPDDGGGGGGGPVGSLDVLPEIDDGQAIRNAVIDMTEAGGHILTHASETKRNWSKLAGVYNAPEEHLVLTAMNKPEQAATDLKKNLRKAGDALNTYAQRCDELRLVRDQLSVDIFTFYSDKIRIQTENPGDGPHQVGLLNEENALLDRLGGLKSALDDAEIACRNSLGDLWGEDNFEKFGDTHVYDTTVYGFSKDGYKELTKQGLTPWKPPSMWTDPHRSVIQARIDQGTVEAAQASLMSAVALTGKLGDGKAKAVWSGVWQTFTDLSNAKNGVVDPEGTQRNIDLVRSLLRLDTVENDPAGTIGGYKFDAATLLLSGGSGAAFKMALKSLSKPVRIIDTPYPKTGPAVNGAIPGGEYREFPGLHFGTPDVNKVGGVNNCVSCAISGDATLAGRPASAIKLNPDVPFKNGLVEIKNYAGDELRWASGESEIERKLLQHGEGTRGIVYGWRSRDSAHVWNAIVQNGKVNYVDFQTGGPVGLLSQYKKLAFVRIRTE